MKAIYPLEWLITSNVDEDVEQPELPYIVGREKVTTILEKV